MSISPSTSDQVAKVHRQFGDIIFTMQDGWPLVHRHGADELKRQWLTLMRSYGDFSEGTAATPSGEGNVSLYVALQAGAPLVFQHTSSESLRMRVQQVLNIHVDLAVQETEADTPPTIDERRPRQGG